MCRLTLVVDDQSLRRPSEAAVLADLLAALLRAVATEADALEHVSVQRGADRIDLVLFHALDSEAEAAEAARLLCRRALAGADRLRSWSLSGGSGLD